MFTEILMFMEEVLGTHLMTDSLKKFNVITLAIITLLNIIFLPRYIFKLFISQIQSAL